MKVYCTDENFVEIQLISLCSIGPFWYSRDRLQEKAIGQTWNVSIARVFINFVFFWFHSVKKKALCCFAVNGSGDATSGGQLASALSEWPRRTHACGHKGAMLREQCAACVHGTRRARARVCVCVILGRYSLATHAAAFDANHITWA